MLNPPELLRVEKNGEPWGTTKGIYWKDPHRVQGQNWALGMEWSLVDNPKHCLSLPLFLPSLSPSLSLSLYPLPLHLSFPIFLSLSSARLGYSFAHCNLASSEASIMDNDNKLPNLHTADASTQRTPQNPPTAPSDIKCPPLGQRGRIWVHTTDSQQARVLPERGQGERTSPTGEVQAYVAAWERKDTDSPIRCDPTLTVCKPYRHRYA